MEQKRSIRLVLKSGDLTQNATTNVGTCDQYRTTFTWSNINLRLLMGDLYDQYDYFNLNLNTIASTLASSNAGAGNGEDRLVYVKLQGLPFINQTYQQSTGNNGQFAYAGIYQIPLTATSNVQYYTNASNVCTFGKSQDLVNLTVSLFRVFDDTKPALTISFPNFSFIFHITGVDKANNPDKINYAMKIN